MEEAAERHADCKASKLSFEATQQGRTGTLYYIQQYEALITCLYLLQQPNSKSHTRSYCFDTSTGKAQRRPSLAEHRHAQLA